ncbi:MAG: putative ABC transport system permease protein [Gammaproteobacteria bacterium]|jgi:putative ABC transport system permease protein
MAVIVAVASVSAVDMFTDRVRAALVQQSSALLAADLSIISYDAIPQSYVQQVRSLALDSTQTLAMRSVVTFDEKFQLVELKAVNNGYPLRGELLVADAAFATPARSDAIPTPGTAWVEARLLGLIGAEVGDQISVGSADLTIAKVLVLEPDRGGDLFNIAPRAMINAADVERTELIAPGSRVRYSLLVAGATPAVKQFKQNINLRIGDRVLSPEDARPEIRAALRRAEQYLGLATLTTIMLAGAAIALAARSFSTRHRDTVALLRTLGASRQYVMQYFLIEIFLLGMFTALIGTAVGIGCQEVIARSLAGWTQTDLPPPAFGSAISAALRALLALMGFALPQLMELREVPPLRVLRSEADAMPVKKSSVVIYATAGILLIAPWRDGDPQLTLWSLFGLLACIVLLIVASIGTIKIVALSNSRSSLVWRFGIANIARRGVLTVIQITALGLGLMALLVLGIVRNDLLDNWSSSLPADAPNQFLINIQSEEVPQLRDFLGRHGLSSPQFYPMVRARLTAINDHEITEDSYSDPRARRLAAREFNLSEATTLKRRNVIIAGQWWDPNTSVTQFSVEQDIAKTLGITVGDSLSYRVAEREIRGPVTSLRAVQWESMEVNFFVEVSPVTLNELPATYITSFRLEPENLKLLRELIRNFPSVTVIDVAALIEHIRAIMDRSAAAIEFVFLFTLVAGVLVLIAAIQATQDERVFESALLKTLGASRALTLRIMSAEFIAIGLIAGAIAGAMALASGWFVATQVLEMDYSTNFSVIAIGILVGISSTVIVGSVAVFNALRHPAATVLRYRD